MYSVHPDYAKLLPRYLTIRDCLNDDVAYIAPYASTAQQITRRKQYLIQPVGMSDTNYEILLQLGRYMNVTGSTLDAMMGLANKKPAAIELPGSIEYLNDNADGEGNGLIAITKAALADTTAMGRYGILVEAPKAMLDDDGNVRQASQADVKNGKVRSIAKSYAPETIVDYEVSVVKGVNQLSLVKLEERITTRDATTYQVEEDTQYRFLILTEQGYEQRLFEDVDGSSQIGEAVAINGYDGKQLQKIEFYFSGSRNNDATADNPPFYKLADKNIALYNLDANNRMNLQLYATGTLIVTGNADDLGEKNIAVGGGGGIYLGDTGSANILQLQAGTALPEAIKVEKEDMVELGAKLAAPDVPRTLGEAEITATQEMALLSDVTTNVQDMMRKVIMSIHMLQTGKELTDFEFTMNDKFFSRPMTAQDRAQWMSEIVSGISPRTLYYKRLRESGDYPSDWTDAQIAEAIEPLDGIIE